MTLYLSNRDGNGKTSEEGHYKFQTAMWAGSVLGATALQVTQNSPTGLSVLVAPGQFKIDTSSDYAYTGWNSSSAAVNITTADPANPRITTIVAYVDKLASTSSSPPNNPGIVKFAAVNGTAGAIPTAPNSTIIQSAVGSGNPYITLANVTVGAGSTTVVNANISDVRTRVTLGSSLVATSSILDSAVTDAKIATNAVTNSKILDDAVTFAKIDYTTVPILKVHRITSIQALPTSGAVNIQFNGEVYKNVAGMHSNSVNPERLIAIVPGVYNFTYTLNQSSGYAGGRVVINAYQYSSSSVLQAVSELWDGSTDAGEPSRSFAWQFKMSANDFVVIAVHCVSNTGGAYPTSGTTVHNAASMTFVGEA